MTLLPYFFFQVNQEYDFPETAKNRINQEDIFFYFEIFFQQVNLNR